MSLEFNNPLYIGDPNATAKADIVQLKTGVQELQGDVSDLQSDVGNLGNLDTVDKSNLVNAINEALSVLDPTQTADYINNSKGLKSGEISTNSTILADVIDYAHSTFCGTQPSDASPLDPKKFTKVGSPTITSDGIYTGNGSSNTNYVTIGSSIDFNSLTNYRIDFSYNQVASTGGCHIVDIGGLYIYQNQSAWELYFKNNGASTKIGASHSSVANAKMDFYLERNRSSFTIGYKLHSSNTWILESNATQTPDTINIASATEIFFNATNPTMDLKNDIKITSNGVPVFSGNKTGIDTVKADDWIIPSGVSSPTITDDGILTLVDISHYIAKNNINILNAQIKVNFLIKTASDITVNRNYFTYSATQNNIISFGQVWYGGDWQHAGFRANFKTSNNNDLTINTPASYTDVKADTWYFIEMEYTSSKAYMRFYELGGDLQEYSTDTNGELYTQTGGNELSIGYSNNAGGQLDLNSFKVYANGDLVYQPCLKIPYTESKTGSKIVNAIYRDRVNDMAEQFGYAPYYTLSDTDFTLPQVELYGLIQRQSDRPSDLYKTLTLGASGDTYTAPTDGYFMLNKASAVAGEYAVLTNETNGFATINAAVTAGNNIRVWLPVKKNDVVKLQYTATGTTNWFRFIYSVGSESEVR